MGAKVRPEVFKVIKELAQQALKSPNPRQEMRNGLKALQASLSSNPLPDSIKGASLTLEEFHFIVEENHILELLDSASQI
ncbi:hypothetical protein [Parachlamydia sp. AcF125]|uniref:hypothetical protein n=1 Tax=Parachlamydia sp. AcF125 TaxID=2795736 RepID=UPI001BC9AD51|nr:hypothetical protein [Parachlamydia sp. AcF125]MBS4167541.1 hypothetical protein [Parachlamydia sp. AcF125]